MRALFIDRHVRFLSIATALILIVATVSSRGQFLDPYNLQNMARQLPEIGLLAIGIMLTMISGRGGIDLSVVATANLAAVVAAVVSRAVWGDGGLSGVGPTLAFALLALATGACCGLLNGVLVASLGFAPILATLGTQILFTGLAVALSGGPAIPLGYAEPFASISTGTLLGVPIPFVLFAAVCAGLARVLGSTTLGLRLYLLGSNARAAHHAGIDTGRLLLVIYAASGTLAGLAGILYASGASSAKWDYGGSYLLIAILIAVMGGVHPDGGYGRISGLVLATVALQFLSSAFNVASLSNFLKDFTWGALLLVSIMLTRPLRWRALWPGRTRTTPPA